MRSSRSSLLGSPEAVRRHGASLRARWPMLVALPVLVAALEAGAAAPLVAMFFGPDFGLSGGREPFSPWAIAALILLGFWSAALLGRTALSRNVSSALLLVLGVAAILGWWALEPVWDVGPVLRAPWTLVSDNGHLVFPLFIGLASWIQGLRLGFDPSLFGPEITRERVRNAIVVLGLGLVLAGLIDGEMGDAGVRAAMLALPVVLVAGAGAIAAAEMEATRRLALRRHATVPGWDRWVRIFGGATLVLLVVTGIGALLLGPGALEMVVEALRGGWRVIATAILWAVYAIVYLLYWIVRAVTWIINAIFGDVVAPIEMPQMEGQAPPEEQQQPLQEPPGMDPAYVMLLRWIGLGVALLIAVIIVFTVLRRRERAADGEVVDEERTSVFSAALAREQLRGLFRRRPKAEHPRRLDLARDPDSVRETMLYLQVLAARQGVARSLAETPHDFAQRLGAAWPGLDEPLAELRDRYERARYGETEEDRRAAVEAWRVIWAARKDVPAEGVG